MTVAEMKAQIESLKAQLTDARKAQGAEIKFKISDKGGLSVYGLGRFPVTLYAGQWERLIEAIPSVKTFLETHKAQFATKGVDYVKPAPVEAPAAK